MNCSWEAMHSGYDPPLLAPCSLPAQAVPVDDADARHPGRPREVRNGSPSVRDDGQQLPAVQRGL